MPTGITELAASLLFVAIIKSLMPEKKTDKNHDNLNGKKKVRKLRNKYNKRKKILYLKDKYYHSTCGKKIRKLAEKRADLAITFIENNNQLKDLEYRSHQVVENSRPSKYSKDKSSLSLFKEFNAHSLDLKNSLLLCSENINETIILENHLQMETKINQIEKDITKIEKSMTQWLKTASLIKKQYYRFLDNKFQKNGQYPFEKDNKPRKSNNFSHPSTDSIDNLVKPDKDETSRANPSSQNSISP